MADPTKPSKYAAKNRAYYLANREHLLEKARLYRLAHLDKLREYGRARRLLTVETLWDKKLQRERGINLAEYRRLEAEQSGVCAICRQPETRRGTSGKLRRYLSIDHDHDTGKVRGLLCSGCNAGLGQFGDDPERMAAALQYLLHFHAPAKEAIA